MIAPSSHSMSASVLVEGRGQLYRSTLVVVELWRARVVPQVDSACGQVRGLDALVANGGRRNCAWGGMCVVYLSMYAWRSQHFRGKRISAEEALIRKSRRGSHDIPRGACGDVGQRIVSELAVAVICLEPSRAVVPGMFLTRCKTQRHLQLSTACVGRNGTCCQKIRASHCNASNATVIPPAITEPRQGTRTSRLPP